MPGAAMLKQRAVWVNLPISEVKNKEIATIERSLQAFEKYFTLREFVQLSQQTLDGR